MNKSGIEGVKPEFTMGDGSKATEITLTRTSVPVAYLNAKVNIASSNNLTNALMTNRYNKYKPYSRPITRDNGVDPSFVKDTMEFYNCVIFIQETNKDLSTHREFADTSYHFYAIGNIGDSKKTDGTRLTDLNDKYECCAELMDVELPLSDWPVDTMIDAMGYNVDEVTGEKEYIWAKDENLSILYEKIDGEYVLTNDSTVDLSKTYYIDALENENFDETLTYGWRYIYEGDDEEENKEVAEYCKQEFIKMYRFVTTSSDEDFKAHFKDYFVVDTALYYFLFMHRYTAVDNFAKNCFFHYGKTEDGNRRWSLDWAYDVDTCLGINNYGKLVYRYGLEITDRDENDVEVFRESDSLFFTRIRNLFANELKQMYVELESKNAFHAESLINECDAWQDEWPEELWRLDTERKYIRSYNSSFINGKGDSQFLVNMCNGKMKYCRRQWERSQEKYMASKYQSSVASSDNAVLRCTKPLGDLSVPVNYKLKLTPYSYMYLNVKYGTQAPIQLRAEPNKEYEIPFTGDSVDILDIYSCSQLISLGDLSTTYPATVDTSKATKLKELKIGNDTAGYDNPNLTTLTLGSNYLLETLNVENVSGLTQALNLSALDNLKEVYAHGSNTSGVTFADGGKIEIAELPAINAITMKNLAYLATLDVTSFEKLTTLTVENCNTVDLISVLNTATNLNRVRITGVDWTLDDTSLLEKIYEMYGLDKSGYNIDQSVLAGKIHVPVIRQQQLLNYQTAWPDLEVVFDTMIEQFAVTFVNDDGAVLEVQYVDKGSNAVDPTTRTEDSITPTKESSVSHDYTFAGWDGSLTSVFSARTITATYTATLRQYTIKYVSKGITMQESTGLYGDNIPYTGVTPTYTGEEEAYVYYLFNRWDKSGFIDGEKVVNAIFDKFEYSEGAFDTKELSTMTPVEIYALTKLDLASKVITDKDSITITIGNDIDYDDIESELIISEKKEFNGTNYYDSGIQLFDEDKDFTLAIDYQFSSGNSLNNVLAQCFQANGSNGFKISMGSDDTAKFTWGTSATSLVGSNRREMVIIRHKKGDNDLIIYKSNLDGDECGTVTLERAVETVGTGTLVFGSARADDGIYENYAKGNVYWAKVWYKDLGDDVCKDLAMWVHEEILFEACGFRKYYLTENTSKRCSFSLLAAHLLDRNKVWNFSSTNTGGWAESALNKSLNNRLYKAFPTQIRSLMKQVRVQSSIGNKSTELSTSDCYITLPSAIEVDPTMTDEPYVNEGTAISYMTTASARIRKYVDGTVGTYWTRSPNVSYSNYVFRVDNTGALYGYAGATNECGILLEISF